MGPQGCSKVGCKLLSGATGALRRARCGSCLLLRHCKRCHPQSLWGQPQQVLHLRMRLCPALMSHIRSSDNPVPAGDAVSAGSASVAACWQSAAVRCVEEWGGRGLAGLLMLLSPGTAVIAGLAEAIPVLFDYSMRPRAQLHASCHPANAWSWKRVFCGPRGGTTKSCNSEHTSFLLPPHMQLVPVCTHNTNCTPVAACCFKHPLVSTQRSLIPCSSNPPSICMGRDVPAGWPAV